jgi:hypothetical protein
VKAVIPSRYEPVRLAVLLMTIVDECESILVLDNGHDPTLADLSGGRITVVDARGEGLYRMWNRGREWAGVGPVAILNDDISISPGTLLAMEAALDDPTVGISYPGTETVTDPLGPYQMTGYCFAFRADLPVGPFDESWHWWCGDTAFEREVLRAGFSVKGVPGSVTNESDAEQDGWARRPELRALALEDAQRWAELVA